MLDMIVLVAGVPVLLFVMLIAMGRFEATVAPDLEPAEGPRVESLGSRVSARAAAGRGPAGEDAEQPQAA